MAWVIRNLFFEGKVEDTTLKEGLRRLIGDNRGGAPLTISPAFEGWRTISGAGGWIDDLPAAAKELASSLHIRVLSCELVAHSYLLRIGEHGADGAQKLLQSPNLPWGAATPHRGEMPLYEDVEQRAHSTLVGMGVPRELLLIGVPALGACDERVIGAGTQLLANEEGELEERSCELSAPQLVSADDAPVVPRERDAGFGLTLADDRYVEGRPTARAVDRLIELEEALLERAKICAPEQSVHLTVTYHGGSHQQQLDALLRARDRFVPPSPRPPATPWWQFWRHFGFKRR